jgi:hypothetical protein
VISNRTESDMTNPEYHAHPALSRSDLHRLLESPAKWAYRKAHPKAPTAAMAQGTALHAAVLEPATLDAVAAELYELRSDAGRKVFTLADLDEAKFMAEAVLADPLAQQLLAGRPEVSCFWTLRLPVPDGSLFDFECKARPDVIGDGWVVDLKSTSSLNAQMFAADVEKYGYDMQVPWYLMGVTGEEQDIISASSQRFVYVVVEKEAPYEVRCYEIPASWRLAAWEKCRKALMAWWRLQQQKPGTLPGDSEVIELIRPRWATAQEGVTP